MNEPAVRSAFAPDLQAIRRRLDRAHGWEYWRSLEELAGTPEARVWLEREFARGSP